MTAKHLIAPCLGLLLLVAPAASAAPFDALFGHVPKSAAAVVAVDQTKLVTHPSYKQLRSLAAAQGGGKGIAALESLGLKAGKDVARSVTYRIGRWAEGAIMQGKTLDAGKLEAAAAEKLGKAFKSGEVSGKRWFLVAKKVQAAELGKGVLVVGSKTAVKKALELAAGKGRSVTARTGFKGMIKAASAGGPVVFGASWVPKKDREALAEQGADDLAAVLRTHYSAAGADAMTVTLVVHTGSAADAKKVAEGVKGKIERKIINSMPMKLLGVAAIAKTIEIAPRGKTAVATSKLSAKQVAALAGTAGKVIKMFEAQAKANAAAAEQGAGGKSEGGGSKASAGGGGGK